jgi:hypothetical protein
MPVAVGRKNRGGAAATHRSIDGLAMRVDERHCKGFS